MARDVRVRARPLLLDHVLRQRQQEALAHAIIFASFSFGGAFDTERAATP